MTVIIFIGYDRKQKRKEGDDLMTCFVIHVSLLSLHIFLKQLFYKKACRKEVLGC